MGKYKKYSEEFKQEIIRLHLEEGRTKKSLDEEYKLGAGTLSNWLKQYREECKTDPKLKEEYDAYKTHQALLKEIAELRKENDFLKKAAATARKAKALLLVNATLFFAKEIN